MTDERWLEQITDALKVLPPISADFNRRVLDEIQIAAPGQRRRWLVPAGLAGVMAAAAAVILLVRGPGPLATRTSPLVITPVEFAIDLPAASEVRLVGDFNDWDRAGTPLARGRGDPRWRATISLRTGLYRYAFLVDGVRWVADPRQSGPVDADFGQPISLLAVE